MQSVANFFRVEASQLLWAHPAPTPAGVLAACQNPATHLLGLPAHLGTADAVPHLGLPGQPGTLDVLGALALAQAHGKGLKLTLHGASCIEATLNLLPRSLTTPLILQANLFDVIAESSHTAPQHHLTPEAFFARAAAACPSAVLSLGWSLPRQHDHDGRLETSLLDQLAGLLTNPQLGALGQDYGVEFRTGNHLSHEWGGILLLDPLAHAPQPQATSATSAPLGGNVVPLARYRRVA